MRDSDLVDLLLKVRFPPHTGDFYPSLLVAHGPQAFTLDIAGCKQPAAVAAATKHGLGRAVHFGHEDYLNSAPWSTVQLHCLDWCVGGEEVRERLGDELIIGTDVELSDEHAYRRFKVRNVPRSSLSIEQCRIYVTNSYSGEHAHRIIDFVAKGGALLSGGHAWNWSYSNSESSGKFALRDYPGNSWLCPLGIAVTSVDADLEVSHRLGSNALPGLISLLRNEANATIEMASALKFSCDQVFIAATLDLSSFWPAWESLISAATGSVGKAWLAKTKIDLSSWLKPHSENIYQVKMTDLLRDVSRIDLTEGCPSLLVAHGPGAFPVVCTNSGVVVAATRYGLGRAVHFGHEGFLSAPAWASMQYNSIDWCVGGKEYREHLGGNLVIGTDLHFSEEVVFKKFKLRFLPRSSLSIAQCQIYVTNSYSAEHADRIIDFVAEGGALLSGGHAWNWSCSNSESSGKFALRDYPGNSWLCPLGIAVTSVNGDYGNKPEIESRPPPGLIKMLQGDGIAPSELGVLKFVCEQVFIRVTVELSAFRAAWEALRTAANDRKTRLSDLGLDMWLFPLLLIEHKESHAGMLVHRCPRASGFPGDIEADTTETAPGSIRTSIDASYEGIPSDYLYADAGAPVWRGTGAYAPPGRLIIVEVPEALVGYGLDILIGCHTDLVPAGMSRPPCIHCAAHIECTKTRIFNPYGGIVYIRVPKGSRLGVHEITVSGAISYPVFSLGQTEPTEWIQELRKATAPMFELRVPGQLIISAPKSAAHLLGDNPETVARLWQRIMIAINEFQCFFGHPEVPGSTERAREERIVLDRKISVGSMHSGYPIMGYLDYDRCLLSAEKITTQNTWGPVHELGHNHQWQGSQFTGTVESSNNVLTVYVHETVLGIPRSSAHEATSDENRRQGRLEYVAGGKNFYEEWGVWVALDTFLQLQEAFGWEPFKTLNHLYRVMETQPSSDQDKIDTFVLLFSQQVSRNLVPFFRDEWGFPVSKSVDETLASLPPWTDHPMVEHE